MGLYSRLIFPFFLNLVMSSEALDELRRDLVRDAKGEVLEIGLGTGANLKFYPDEIKSISAVEPNAGMNSYIHKKEKRFHREVHIAQGSAEAIPFPSGTFDTVVSTFTLCSIPRVEQALSEIRRVLKPGGRFLFVEHGSSPDTGVARWQRRLDGVSQVLADGCHLTRDMESLVKSSGMEGLHLEKFYIRGMPKTHAYIYKGVATK